MILLTESQIVTKFVTAYQTKQSVTREICRMQFDLGYRCEWNAAQAARKQIPPPKISRGDIPTALPKLISQQARLYDEIGTLLRKMIEGT